MSKTDWGIFKGTYAGEGIYWQGAYNVEGLGQFDTMQGARDYIDNLHKARAARASAEAMAKVQAGKAILCERQGDMVKVHLPSGTVEMTIRAYRQQVFDLEKKHGREFVWA